MRLASTVMGFLLATGAVGASALEPMAGGGYAVESTIKIKSAKFTGTRTLTGTVPPTSISAKSFDLRAGGPADAVGDWSLHATSLAGIAVGKAVPTSNSLWITYYDSATEITLYANMGECNVTFDKLGPGGVSGTYTCTKKDKSASFDGTFSATPR